MNRIMIKPQSPGVPQRIEAVEAATALGTGVRMELHSSHTEFYADPQVDVGKVAIYVPREYKGWPEYEVTLDAPDDLWESPLDRAMRERVEAALAEQTRLDEAHKTEVRNAVGTVLTNASNFHERLQSRMLGLDMGPLIDRVTTAVLAVEAPHSATQHDKSTFPASREGNA